MSLIVTICTSEGLIMASDSRSTYNQTDVRGEKVIVKFGVHYTDTTYKTFLCDDRIGISTCGDGTICGKSIAGHIEDFIYNIYDKDNSVETISQKLGEYFNKLPEKNDVTFHVAGYKKENEKDVAVVYKVSSIANQINLLSEDICGANWDGECATLTRLMKNSYVVSEENAIPIGTITLNSKNDDGTEKTTVLKNQIAIPGGALRQPELDIAWNHMTLQDGIDFAEYAIKTTIDTMRFQVASKTVGGPIDILVIKPNGTQWIRRKELHA